jgi:hypothetical protein
MILVEVAPDEVGRVRDVVVPIGDRRDRERRQRPFPELPEEESDEEPPTPAPDDSEPRPNRRPPGSTERESESEPDDDRTIDLLVLSLIVPTRQQLPGIDGLTFVQ